jgi:hypothetical protein
MRLLSENVGSGVPALPSHHTFQNSCSPIELSLANMMLPPPSSFPRDSSPLASCIPSSDCRYIPPLSRTPSLCQIASREEADFSRHRRGLNSPAAALSLKSGANSLCQECMLSQHAWLPGHMQSDLDTGNCWTKSSLMGMRLQEYGRNPG